MARRLPKPNLQTTDGASTNYSSAEVAVFPPDTPKAIAVPPVIKIVTGILLVNVYDAKLQMLDDNDVWFDQPLPDVWAIDLCMATSLIANSRYDAVYVRDGVAGPYYISIVSPNSNNSLDDTHFWIPSESVIPSLWSSSTDYPVGSVVNKATGRIYVAVVENTNNDPASSADWVDITLGFYSVGAYDPQKTYIAGNFVQEERAIYSFNSIHDCNAFIRIPYGSLPDAGGWILAYRDEWNEASQKWVQVETVYVRDANS